MLSVILFSCSGSDDAAGTEQLTFNNQSYDFDHAYIEKVEGNEYAVFLTKGSMEFDYSQIETTYTYSSDFKRLLVFTVIGLEGTKLFPASPDVNSDNFLMFRDNYTIVNGHDSEFNTLISQTDNNSDQSRVTLHKVDESKYSFDFNVITASGTLTGKYTGEITKTNY